MKRKLNAEYKDLVDYVKEESRKLSLFQIMTKLVTFDGGTASDDKIWSIMDNLYIIPLSNTEYSDFIRTVVDIYNDNYELQELKYYWKLKDFTGYNANNLYLSPRIGMKLSGKTVGLLDPIQYSITKFTKSEVDEFLGVNTLLTTYNFEPVEVCE